jgi:anti-sigma factor RsiW
MSVRSLDQCKEVVELVNEYLGHALTPEDRAAFDAHLTTCPPCTTYLEQMRTVLDLAGALGKAPPAADVEQELLVVFKRWQDKSSR